MSASLVGSEMCIRDRGEGDPTQTDPPGPDLGAAETRHVPVFPWGGRLAAVSYTHLTLPTICSV
eukprot:579962-Alexandrium_andersonii.AAC.1